MSSELNLKSISSLLTVEILQEAVNKIHIKKHGNNTTCPTIVTHTVNFASSKGDGYMGVVYRINVTLSNDISLNIIGKSMPHNLVRRNTFKCNIYFEKEIYFYNKIVPAFRELEVQQRGQKVADENSLLCIPDCYYAVCDGINDFLLLEDLNEDGYNMFDRTSGLDTNQTTKILEVVAQFHAFSYAMKALQPEKYKELSSKVLESFFGIEHEERLGKYMHKLAELFHRGIKDELKDTKYLTKFENFIKDEKVLFKNLVKLVEEKEPSVLTHSDCWATNFMYKMCNNELQVQAIDFQMMRCGSPVVDISIYVFSCMTSQQRADMGGVQQILQAYHKQLTSTVCALGAPQSHLTWQQLCEHWQHVGGVGFGYALELVPLSLVEHDDVQDLDRWQGEDAIPLTELTQFKDITDTEGKKRLVDLVKLAVDEGML